MILFSFFILYYLNILHLTAQNNIGILRQKMYILYILNIFISKYNSLYINISINKIINIKFISNQ